MNVIKLPKTLGIALTASGIASQRSGLQTDRKAHGLKKKKEAESGICTAQVARAHAQIPVTSDQGRNNAYLNSSASSPHNDFSL
jgi:hypothetical protein